MNELPNNILFQIWEFAKPARKILLKDMHSKTGVYQKIKNAVLKTGMEIVLGDSRPLTFHHREIYDTGEQMKVRLDWLRERDYVVLNPCEPEKEVCSFWTMSFKTQNYVLLDYPCRLTIGRSSSNTFVICEASISRRHATL